jgi:hypothetical protein
MTTSKLQTLAAGLDRRSNDYTATVVGDRIRVSNLSDPNWRGRTAEYAAAFSRLTELPASIDWSVGYIWLGPAAR